MAVAPNNFKPRKSLWKQRLDAAISSLYADLEIAETNAPINKREGDLTQARYETRVTIPGYREAIRILEERT